MIGEERVAYIPKMLIEGDFGSEEYGMLVTTHRLIFVVLTKTYATFVGMMYDQWKNPRGPVDVGAVDLNQLSAMKHNFILWNTQLSRYVLKRKLITNRLEIHYTNRYGNAKKVKCDLLVPDDFYSMRRKEGAASKEITNEYLSRARDALMRVASPAVAAASEWPI